jgi:hypothetical protein
MRPGDHLPSRADGDWNLECKWSSDHLVLLQDQECDVWLLSEVPTQASIPGMAAHRTVSPMWPTKTWASIFSIADVIAQPDVIPPRRGPVRRHAPDELRAAMALLWRVLGRINALREDVRHPVARAVRTLGTEDSVALGLAAARLRAKIRQTGALTPAKAEALVAAEIVKGQRTEIERETKAALQELRP